MLTTVRAAALVPSVALVLAGCGGSGGNSTSPAPTRTATATVTVTAKPDPVEQSGTLRLGQTADVGFARITPLQVNPNVPVDNYKPQKRWAAVIVRTCATTDKDSKGDPISVSWEPWTVNDRQDGVYQITGLTGGVTYPVPTYPTDPPQRLVKGQCIKGWITFNVALGVKLTSVTYTSSRAPRPVTWTF